ncbi:MAG: hypothetical protein HS116_07195 [Planctomycetes bacterium]|nr:hypothetical protein [Planctomycetota bacterium]
MSEPAARPSIGIGAIVAHPLFGQGRVSGYDGSSYVVVFKGGETKHVAFTFEGMKPEGSAGDPELDRIKEAVRQVLGEQGWLDAGLELGRRWTGGTIRLIPGKDDTQPKDIPIEQFFGKLIGIREKLRVLEQKLNNHPQLSAEDKAELQGYITRSYGSLTSFNVLFADKGGQFKGTGGREG